MQVFDLTFFEKVILVLLTLKYLPDHFQLNEYPFFPYVKKHGEMIHSALIMSAPF